MGTLNRFAGCLIGAAIGDAIGRQATGTLRPDLVPLTNDPLLDWSERTQHLVLTSRGLIESLRWPYDRRVVGRAVAGELVDWYHDPTVAERTPSRSSLAAAVRLLEGADWETSGNTASDGADPLFRALAVGLAYPTDEVAEPAVLVTKMTHGHPTVLQGAVLLAWLVSALVRGETLSPGLARQAARVAASAHPTGSAARSVETALRLVAERVPGASISIDPRELPDGDCGHRAASAVGLATFLALVHQAQGPDASIERSLAAAARLPGAGEVVASLTGALLGAAQGLTALPEALVRATASRDDLLALSRALHQRARGVPLGSVGLGEPDQLGWVASTPDERGTTWSPETEADGTDLEWSITQFAQEETPPEPPIEVDPSPDVDAGEIEWITVAGESPKVDDDEVNAAKTPIRRRW